MRRGIGAFGGAVASDETPSSPLRRPAYPSTEVRLSITHLTYLLTAAVFVGWTAARFTAPAFYISAPFSDVSTATAAALITVSAPPCPTSVVVAVPVKKPSQRSVAVSTVVTHGGDDEILPPESDLPKLNITSTHQCFSLPEGAGHVDVLGDAFTMGHYCVLTNVCVDRKNLILFDTRRAGQRYDFPRQALLQEKAAVYETNAAPTAARSILINQKTAPGKRVFQSGTSVLLRHSYCCSHIRHFLEPVPMLHEALRDLAANATRAVAGSIDLVEGKPAVHRVVVVPGSSPATDMIPWTRLMIDVALTAAHTPTRTNLKGALVNEPHVWAIPLLTSSKREAVAARTRCFERVIIPSAEYAVFRNGASAAAFRDDLYRVLTPKKWTEYRRTNDSWWIANEAPGELAFRKKESERIILISTRKSKRSILDMDLLIEWIREFAAPYGAIVKTIEYGKHSAMSQAVHSQEADVLVALHGADLTNLMFQREGAMVVELNPIFFFESGYYEMARRLGIHYAAWTCTAPSCAFKGASDVWNRFFPPDNLIYNTTTRDVLIPSVDTKQRLRWPFKGYAGGCVDCKRILESDVVRPHFYSGMRDGVTVVAQHKAEFEEVFRDVFERLRWTRTISSNVTKST